MHPLLLITDLISIRFLLHVAICPDGMDGHGCCMWTQMSGSLIFIWCCGVGCCCVIGTSLNVPSDLWLPVGIVLGFTSLHLPSTYFFPGSFLFILFTWNLLLLSCHVQSCWSTSYYFILFDRIRTAVTTWKSGIIWYLLFLPEGCFGFFRISYIISTLSILEELCLFPSLHVQ